MIKLPSMKEVLSEAVSRDNIDSCGVYFLFDKNKVCVWVGATTRGIERITEHRDKDFDSYTFMKCDEDMMFAIEAHYIGELKPKYNIMENPDWHRFGHDWQNVTLASERRTENGTIRARVTQGMNSGDDKKLAQDFVAQQSVGGTLFNKKSHTPRMVKELIKQVVFKSAQSA